MFKFIYAGEHALSIIYSRTHYNTNQRAQSSHPMPANKVNLIQNNGFYLLLTVIYLSQLCYAQLPSSEATAMQDLKGAINPNPWTTGEPNLCFWEGVTCTNDGTNDHIDTLNLKFSSAYTIALPASLGNLVELQQLIFEGATFLTPVIPAELAATSMNYISFTRCSGITFPESGTTPFLNLRFINVYASSLTNLPPADVFPALTSIYITSSTFTVPTTIPTNYSSIITLGDLTISNTNLGGTIPSELSTLPALRALAISHNQLIGTIPPELGNIPDPNFFLLSLASNQLNGTIPATLGNLASLQTVLLHGNRLTGTIPSELFKPSVQQILLGPNQLTTPYPDTSQATSLVGLNVLGNLFPPGPIPINFYGIPTLIYFDGSANQFTGSIPIFAGPLQSLLLANNTLTGTIPQFTQSLDMYELNLANNNLTGIIPQFILDMQFSALNFVGNSLAGCVTPSNFDGPVYTCHFGGNVMCCPEGKELACDADITQCLACGSSQPTTEAVCAYDETFKPVWHVNGDILLPNTSTPIENTVINGNLVTTNIVLNSVVINGNLSVNGQLTVDNGFINVRGCVFINGSLVINMTPEESQQLAANGTLDRTLLTYDATCRDSSVDFNQITVNGEADCSEAVGSSQNTPGLITVLITSQKFSCNVQEPVNGGPTSTNTAPDILPDWGIALIVVGCVLAAGAIAAGVLVHRHLENQKTNDNLQKKLRN